MPDKKLSDYYFEELSIPVPDDMELFFTNLQINFIENNVVVHQNYTVDAAQKDAVYNAYTLELQKYPTYKEHNFYLVSYHK